jgi:hypothetical protein
VAWQVWGDWLHRGDLVVFAILYVTTGLGITVGFHRHLTHRAFAARRPVRAVLVVLGSAAIELGWLTIVSTMRSPMSRATRTARTSATDAARAERSRACSTRTSAGCSSTPNATPGVATRLTCSQTRAFG